MRPILQGRKKNYKLWFLYGIIFIVCIIAIGLSVYMQYFKDEKIGVIFGITDSEDEDAYNELKNNFNTIFTNDVSNMQGELTQCKKIKEEFDYVVDRYRFSGEQEKYTLDVTIPIINIDSKEIEKYNQQIEDIYIQKLDEIKKDTGYIYNVKYKCYIQNNILSLVIYSELKQKNANQKIMIETYNYSLIENRQITLEEILNEKNIKISEANDKIKREIKDIQKKNDSLNQLGYNLYKRDISSNIYEISNINQYFLGEGGNIYTIFAYGNYDQTSEMDIVIFMNKNY